MNLASKPNILLVDDDTSILEVLTGYLQDDYNILSHSEWPPVANTLARNNIDLMLVDLQMPSLKGDQLISVIKESCKNPPKIVLMSAHDAGVIAQKAKECGADGYLQKMPPFSTILNELRIYF